MKYLLILLLFAGPLLADFESNQVLFFLTQGNVSEAVDLYEDIHQKRHKHDFLLLRQMSLVLLDRAFKSKEPELQLMAIFGAGIGSSDDTFYLLEEGLKSPFPQIQVVALNVLGRTQNDQAYELLNKLMGSPYALIRLEAAHQLALIKHPKATAQLEALMQKVDPAAASIFPQFFALVGDDAALKILRKLLTHKDHAVRIAAIEAACSTGRDELLPQIRKLATQHDHRQLEQAAMALGIFKDTPSQELLRKLTLSPHRSVGIAALKALYLLGEKERGKDLQNIALTGDLFAINVLGEIPGSEETLLHLMAQNSVQVRLNATLALLKLKDPRALQGVGEILVKDGRDLAYASITSSGHALTAWKAIPSAAQQGEDAPILLELSLGFKEAVLAEAVELPERDFLSLANYLFNTRQTDLIPMLTELLINMDTQEATLLLKKQQQKIGAPLIRNWANLALVKLKEEGPYLDNLKTFALAQSQVDMMKFRTFVPFEMREHESHFELTPEESARLLVEALEVLSESDEEGGIDLLLKVLKEGQPKNYPVIAGLLLKAAN